VGVYSKRDRAVDKRLVVDQALLPGRRALLHGYEVSAFASNRVMLQHEIESTRDIDQGLSRPPFSLHVLDRYAGDLENKGQNVNKT
jgi:hypothetical protein